MNSATPDPAMPHFLSGIPVSTAQYQVGGSLPMDAPTYVMRQADDDLYQGLKSGEFCYVLNSRQMGKSSLRVQTMRRLTAEGIACAAVDVTKIGSQNITPEQWYASLIGALVAEFQLGDRFQLRPWWRDHQFLSPAQCLTNFIEQVLLPTLPQNIVIFIDEIDSLLSLNFPMDDFFALLRAHFNHRVDQADARRLTFALFGVAAPSSLIQDKQRTPFNIGRAIPLGGFEWPAAQPLAQGLASKTSQPEVVLNAVLTWTGGQPFLTQKLCKLIATTPTPIPVDQEAVWVDALVRSQVIENWEANDEPEHLRTIRNRLLNDEQRASRLLGLYQRILQGEMGRWGDGEEPDVKRYPADKQLSSLPASSSNYLIPCNDSSEQIELQLSGIVMQSQGYLRIRNPIYAAVFNPNWVEKELEQRRPYAEAFQAWVMSQGQDESRLLRGQALQEALLWAAPKSLSDRDYQFLNASQRAEQQQVQLSLEAERQAKLATEAANQILTQAHAKARRITRRAMAALVIVTGISICAIAVGVRTNQDLQEFRQSLALEQEGVLTLQQFGVNELAALQAAIASGQTLQKLVKPNRTLSNYPTVKPLFVLQTILDQIHERNSWLGHQGFIRSSYFSPDGQRLVTGGKDGQIRLWNLKGKLLHQFKIDSKGVQYANVLADGQRLITVTTDGKIRLWDLSGRPLTPVIAQIGDLNSLRFHPSGDRFATATPDGQVHLWDLSGQQLAKFDANAGQVNSLGFTSQGDHLVTVGADSQIQLWTLSGQLLTQWSSRLEGRPALNSVSVAAKVASQTASAYRPQHAVTVGENGMIQLWDLGTKQLLNQWRGSRTPLYSVSLSPNGQRLVTLGEDGIARIWDLSGHQLAALKGHTGLVGSTHFSPDGQQLVTTDMDGRIHLWDLSRQPQWSGRHQSIWTVTYSPDGKHLATAGQDGKVRVWDLQGQPLLTIAAHPEGVNDVVFSPNGQHLATAGVDDQVQLWNRSGQRQIQLKVDASEIYDLSYSPQGQYLAAAGNDGMVYLWHTSTHHRRKFEVSSEPLWSLDWSPNGQQLATTGKDGKVHLWTVGGQRLSTFDAQQGWLTSIRFGLQGQQLASAGKDGTVRLWTLKGQLKQDWRSHPNSILGLVFSQNGQKLAVAGQDGIVRLWTPTGHQLGELTGHQGPVYSLGFQSDDASLVTVGQDDRIRVWQTGGLAQLLRRGCDWLQDYMKVHQQSATICRGV